MTRRSPWVDDPSMIVKVVLPVIYAGASLRLLALLRSSSDPAVRELGVALTAVAGGGSMIAPTVLDAVADVTGDANYGRFFSQLCTVVAAGQGEAVMLRSVYPAPDEADAAVMARRRWMLGTLVVMGILFSQDRSAAAELQVPSDRLYTPLAAAYWLAFTSFTMQTAAEVGRLTLRASWLAEEYSLRVGLRTTAGGALLLAGFYGQYAVGVGGGLVSTRFPQPLRGVPAQAVIGSGAALIALGTSLRGATRRWQAARQHLLDTHRCLALRQVWRPLRGVRAETARATGTVLSPADVRLLRRVIEILDALHRLAGDLDPRGQILTAAEEVGRQRGLDAEEVIALQRAALIYYAAEYGDGSDAKEAELDQEVFSAGAAAHSDFREEARRLLRVKAYLRSPSLPRLVAQTVSEDAERSLGPCSR